jgi:hypothetical protein
MKNENGNGLEALYEKEKALRERIAKAKAQQQKREALSLKCDAGDLGGALITADEKGAIPPDLKTNIKAVILAAGGLEDRQKQRLQKRGWI